MVPQEGREAALRPLLSIESFLGTNIRLAKAIAGVPDDEVTLADITECDFDGYASKSNVPYSGLALNGDGQAFAQTAKQTFTAGGGIAAPQTILAVYITFNFDSVGDQVFWFARLSPTVTLVNPGEVYEVIVRILADDLPI